ncbi:MAG: VOC family protein [Gammaproteobacteria bacterium]|nr:VOC family protein [Gammaproteobacteria bacterium]
MQSIVRSVGAAFVAVILLSGCAGFGNLSGARMEMAQTPITDNPSGKAYPGKFIWHDLLTPDPQLAGQFYEKLFGWQIDFQGQYAVVRNGDRLIAGIIQVEPEDGQPRDGVWLPSVSVQDVDRAASRVKANGGVVLKGPIDMSQRGRAILISDPQRADLVLLNAKGGDPADTEAAIGDWLWDEIWTDDPDRVEEFYRQVLKYDEMVSGSDYDVFMHNGKWRAGIRHVQGKREHMLWVPVVRVADPGVTVKRVEALGGKVWIGPDEAPSRGDTALIGDTTGALLLIQRWPPRSSKGGQ